VLDIHANEAAKSQRGILGKVSTVEGHAASATLVEDANEMYPLQLCRQDCVDVPDMLSRCSVNEGKP
jgi:hypothetical protein